MIEITGGEYSAEQYNKRQRWIRSNSAVLLIGFLFYDVARYDREEPKRMERKTIWVSGLH